MKWLKNTFTAQAVAFIAGLVASIVMRALFGQVIPLSQAAVNLLLIFLAVFSVAVIVGIRQEIIVGLIQSKLSAKVYHAMKAPGGDIPLYDPVIQTISLAKQSIRVIGLYRSPDLEATPGRKRYYQKIDEILENKRKRGERFRYERILQVREVSPGRLDSTQIDSITFQHCQRLLDLQRQKTELTIRLSQIPDILGSLSFVIVDEREIVLAVPAVTRTNTTQLKALQLGTGIIFTDEEGSLAKELLNLFDDLRLQSDEIYTVEPSTG